MEIHSFDSTEEMMAHVARQQELAESLTFPWQRELKVGDYVVGFADDGDEAWGNYGRVVEGPTLEMPNYRLVRIYNRLYPDDAELEAPFLSTWSGKLTQAQYKLCQKAGWPATNWEMFRTIHPNGAVLRVYGATGSWLRGTPPMMGAWVGEVNGRFRAHYIGEFYGDLVDRHGRHNVDDKWGLLADEEGYLLRWAAELESDRI